MKNDIIRCRCIDMSVEGLGIARAGNLVIFVKGMIKGEEADVRIIAEKKNYSIGIIEKMIVPSPNRLQSDCPIAYKCGGCDYRHIQYDYQLKLKKEVLENTLKGYEIKDIAAADNPFYYRNKVQIPCRDHKMGFYRRFSNDIVEFDDCLIESRTANQIISDLKVLLSDKDDSDKIRHIVIKHAQGTDEVMLGIVVNSFDIDLNDITDTICHKYPQIQSVILNLNDKETNVILGDEERVLYGRNHIFDVYDGIKVKLSLKSFYQVNYWQMLKLYARIKGLAQVKNNSRILDLYCGIGTISLYLARNAGHVTGVEIVKEAVEDARENAMMNHLNNTDFILADASKGMDKYLKDKNTVIVDPPRKGLSQELITSLCNSRVERIVYVSCNPATLARDLELLKEKYDVGTIHPVDMFPYTVHLECVVALQRKS
ncbi:MAG: 23S rRNA (uracil(1939)-C(5))-methyltransferase RlmD [Erysipelotrichaceae bacterium]|nr:23S rRNA (uracil(1939)-C(5))-methyltransferase RlmD [Erysipelotrichaceae bacterium]